MKVGGADSKRIDAGKMQYDKDSPCASSSRRFVPVVVCGSRWAGWGQGYGGGLSSVPPGLGRGGFEFSDAYPDFTWGRDRGIESGWKLAGKQCHWQLTWERPDERFLAVERVDATGLL